MSVKITHDSTAPTASLELMIAKPLPDYDLEKVEASIPREIDPILASQGFKDLLDEARSVLDRELAASGLEIAQLTGAICHDHNIHRPGIWVVLRESHVSAGQAMSAAARARVASIAETLRTNLGMS
ncbi:MAG: hypothetical protein WBC04_18500 [Candidatus Acidiferrales bacterium]